VPTFNFLLVHMVGSGPKEAHLDLKTVLELSHSLVSKRRYICSVCLVPTASKQNPRQENNARIDRHRARARLPDTGSRSEEFLHIYGTLFNTSITTSSRTFVSRRVRRPPTDGASS
jgi:hypothetical protein